jgi:hypothetical protein
MDNEVVMTRMMKMFVLPKKSPYIDSDEERKRQDRAAVEHDNKRQRKEQTSVGHNDYLIVQDMVLE